MSKAEHNQLKLHQSHAVHRWENQPAEGWTLDHLDITEIHNTISEAVLLGRLNDPGSRDPQAILQRLDLTKDGRILQAAVVLFGNQERLACDYPQCKLRVARFRGLDKSEFIDNRQFKGNAFEVLRSGERFLSQTIPIASRFESGRIQRIDVPQYPPLATREALANAICHRDYMSHGGSIDLAVYDDRLELSSSGILHFGFTPENLFQPHQSKPWNPLIANTFYRRGIIEEWGRGTNRIAEMATSAGLPHPEIEEDRGNEVVTVRFRAATFLPLVQRESDFSEQQNSISALLRQNHSGLAFRDIVSQLGPQSNERQTREVLATLQEKGIAMTTGHGRSARWRFASA